MKSVFVKGMYIQGFENWNWDDGCDIHDCPRCSRKVSRRNNPKSQVSPFQSHPRRECPSSCSAQWPPTERGAKASGRWMPNELNVNSGRTRMRRNNRPRNTHNEKLIGPGLPSPNFGLTPTHPSVVPGARPPIPFVDVLPRIRGRICSMDKTGTGRTNVVDWEEGPLVSLCPHSLSERVPATVDQATDRPL